MLTCISMPIEKVVVVLGDHDSQADQKTKGEASSLLLQWEWILNTPPKGILILSRPGSFWDTQHSVKASTFGSVGNTTGAWLKWSAV